jgi:hypothetical protein
MFQSSHQNRPKSKFKIPIFFINLESFEFRKISSNDRKSAAATENNETATCRWSRQLPREKHRHPTPQEELKTLDENQKRLERQFIFAICFISYF